MSTAVVEETVTVNGLPVRYREAGAGEPIVFLHGAGGAPPKGASFVGSLAERHHVLIPSRPGFDDTPAGNRNGVLGAAETMAGFVRATADGAVHLVAQSAGGAVACWMAILNPALVKSLVLSAPAAFAVRHGAAGPRPAPEEIERRLYGATPAWTAPPTEEERRRIQRNAAYHMSHFNSPDGHRDLLERLADIKAPTLLLVATRDEIVPEEAMRPYQKHIADCHRMFIYGAAHELPIAAGPRWVALVADFIDRGEAFSVNPGTRDGGR
jgi:pimeloyl-ACP methyl ester carboxylesterase